LLPFAPNRGSELGLICPYCNVGFKPDWHRYERVARDGSVSGNAALNLLVCNCSECTQIIVHGRWTVQMAADRWLEHGEEMAIFPVHAPDRLVPPEVVDEYAQDFKEATAVLPVSPKASAALSRRLLQHIIREKAGIQRPNLNREIDDLIDSNQLPTDLAHDLDMIRQLGNFAAHPVKATVSGQIVDIEPGEAEALLDLLEELLDFYFVRPARRQQKRDALNAKLAAAGKPALKGTPESSDEPAAPATLEPG
jgi:hypothetical protein